MIPDRKLSGQIENGDNIEKSCKDIDGKEMDVSL